MTKDGVGSDKIIRRTRAGDLEYLSDDLTIEEPLEIRIGRKTLAITMRTPGHDEELSVGFLLSEALIRSRDEIAKIGRPRYARNRENIISVELVGNARVPTTSVHRFGTITSSCGVCGKESIAAVQQNFSPIRSHPGSRIDLEVLLSLPDLLHGQQGDFARTGGIHAAGIFDIDGSLHIVREDVGRHNAVDKIIGRAVLDGMLPLDRHVLIVSGRASFEIVQKALAAGIPIIGSVSAPSTLAVSFCRQNNQTLVGFLRPPSFNVYSHVERIILDGEESKKREASAKHAN